MRRFELGRGFASKNFSMSSALAFEQKQVILEPMVASIRDGDAFASLFLINEKFCKTREKIL